MADWELSSQALIPELTKRLHYYILQMDGASNANQDQEDGYQDGTPISCQIWDH